MNKFPSTEIKDKWGSISEAALREPITITKRGRPSLVVMSVHDYEELKRDHLETLRLEVRKGIEEAKRGEFSNLTINEIKREALRRQRAPMRNEELGMGN